MVVERAKEILKKIEETKDLNIFLHVNKDLVSDASKNKKGKLKGKFFAIKACIAVKGMPLSCASKTLQNYIAPYDADVVKKIKDEGGLIVGIVNMDEFASGSSGETSVVGPTKNPVNPSVIPGGSSSGSAAAVAAGLCDVALGSDTGGSVRNPASHCGVIGIKPRYGRVSRYGLVDLSMSLDQIGVLSKSFEDAKLTLEVISGKSDFDPTTIDDSTEIKVNKKIIFARDKKLEKFVEDKRIMDVFNEYIKGIDTKDVEIKHAELSVQTYYPIVYTEFFSGTRKFDGRQYGKKIEDSCGIEVLRRIKGGEYISKAEYKGKHYRKALGMMKHINQQVNNALKKCDAIILPTVPRLPHKIGEKLTPKQMYGYDIFTIPANLSGICAASIPAGNIDGLPIGIQIYAENESDLFSAIKILAKV